MKLPATRLFPPALFLILALTRCAGASPTPAPAPIVTATAAFAFGLGTRDPEPPQVLRYALAPFTAPVDPQWNCQPRMGVLLGVVYETLVHLSDSYTLEPSLAKSWKVSADEMSYTFQLHPWAKFHDGTFFTAEVVRRNLDRIAASPLALLPSYLGADAIDEKTVRVRFSQPYPTFLYQLSRVCMVMLSPTAFGADSSLRGNLPAGTGPFRIVSGEVADGRSLTLAHVEEYAWGPASYKSKSAWYSGGSGEDYNSPCRTGAWLHEHTNQAFLETVTFQFISDLTQRINALESGQTDAVENLSLIDAERLKQTGRFWVFTVPLPTANDASIDRETSMRRRIAIQALTPGGVRAAPNPPDVVFNAQRREVNCLSYGAHAWNTTLYDTSIRGIP